MEHVEPFTANQELRPELCPECKDLTFLQNGVRHNVIITPGNRYEPADIHKCKVCVNCSAKYVNREIHHDDKGHWPDEPVRHCTTWDTTQ